MDDLIIGATISLLSALLTFILTSAFQWMKEERNRKWVVEDKKFERRLQVLNLRLKEVETYINQHFEIATKTMEYEFGLLSGKDDYFIFLDKTTSLFSTTTMAHSSLLNLDDKELNDLCAKLLNYIVAEQSIAKQLATNLKNDVSIDISSEKNRITNFYISVTNLRKQMIKRVDQLAGFQ